MKKIYTSYYGNIKNILQDDNINKVLLVQISGSSPEFFKTLKDKNTIITDFKMMFPTWDLVNNYKTGLISPGEYTEEYLNLIERRMESRSYNWRKMYLDLEYEFLDPNYQVDTVVLLCYEGKNQFCHRHIIAKKFKELGLACEEY